IGHESGEWMTRIARYRRGDREELCNFLAGAIIAPRPAMLRAAKCTGLQPGWLAARFRCGPVAISLRYVEVTGRPLAIVTEERIYVRGEHWQWGTAAELRRIAAGERPPLPMRRISLGRGRVALQPFDE